MICLVRHADGGIQKINESQISPTLLFLDTQRHLDFIGHMTYEMGSAVKSKQATKHLQQIDYLICTNEFEIDEDGFISNLKQYRAET